MEREDTVALATLLCSTLPAFTLYPPTLQTLRSTLQPKDSNGGNPWVGGRHGAFRAGGGTGIPHNKKCQAKDKICKDKLGRVAIVRVG
jgi:hypothetical protein